MKSILIIGAKSDMAIATAEVYAQHGWNLYLAGRNIKDELAQFVNELKNEFDCKVELLELDILDIKSHSTLFNSFIEKPDGVISFVGLLGDQKKSEFDYREARNVIDTNFTSIISMLNIFANYYEGIERGFIIGISSVAGDRGRKSNYIYGAAKAAFTVYLSGLRNRLNSKNVHVMTVKPGFVDTKMTQNMDLPTLLTVSPKVVAKKLYKMHEKRVNQFYVPGYWFLIMFIIKLIPERIFKHLNI